MGRDGLAFLVAVLCVAGAILFLAGRRALIHMKDREVKKAGATLMAEREELEQRANELEALQAEIDRLRASLADLATQKLILGRRGRKRADTSRRFTHEIGRSEPGRSLFAFSLSMAPGFLQRPDAKAVVHPAIWAFENRVEVWAADFPAAQMLTRTVFNDAVGVTVGAPEGEAGGRAGDGRGTLAS
ncbi:hypothetical protein ACIU1J_08995 [Azospirillum doebereinerae]|uniref:hypothetical protein n=1 Tax=Azospirillum doebereinerae TaxID=92933 RepID=UPI001EE5D18A|nr:hypothetical protein [Azospirillum doebereinerae]MCG5241059.1 hypothetical protein [Azospirillum doebereinerae]